MNFPLVDWILVADRSRATILKSLAGTEGKFSTEGVFEHEEGRFSRREMESDKPGRMSLPGKIRTSVEPHEDPEHREARRFATVLIDHLDRAATSDQFDRLIIIAPPVFLGVLREELTPKVRSRVAYEFHKELMQLPENQLRSRVAEILEANAV